jgi:hypothetical protein
VECADKILVVIDGKLVHVNIHIKTRFKINEVEKSFAAFGPVKKNGSYHLVRLNDTNTDFINYMREEAKKSYPKKEMIVLDHADYCILIHELYLNKGLTYEGNRTKGENKLSLYSKPGEESPRNRKGRQTPRPTTKQPDAPSDVGGKHPHQSTHSRHGSQNVKPNENNFSLIGMFRRKKRDGSGHGGSKERHGDSKERYSNSKERRGDSNNHSHQSKNSERKPRFSLRMFGSREPRRPKHSDYEKYGDYHDQRKHLDRY